MENIPSTGEFLFRPEIGQLVLRFPFPVEEKFGNASTFHLTSASSPTYDTMLTVEDDSEANPDDDVLELIFFGLSKTANYSLEVDPGGGKPKYWMFKDRPYSELVTP